MGLFARRGFRGTTTRQIADEARVNEAIIFRHFPKKEDLYWAILAEQCRTGRRRRAIEVALEAGVTDRELFVDVAAQFLRRTAEDRRLSRLLLFSALEHHRLSHRFFRTYVARYYEALAATIRDRIRAGTFRRVDPLLAARGFLGMLVYHSLIQELFGGDRDKQFDPRAVGATLTDIWLGGMLRNHRNGRRSKPSKSR